MLINTIDILNKGGKMVRKWMCALLGSTVLIVGALVVSMAVSHDTTNNTQLRAAVFGVDWSGGGLTVADPFVIYTREGLIDRLQMQAHNQGRHFRLGADINLFGHNWVPIATFQRLNTFDGDDHVIRGLTIRGTTITSAQGNNRGMFMNFLGSMSNVTFEDVYIDGQNISGQPATSANAGVIAGNITGNTSVGDHIQINNVHVIRGQVGSQTHPVGRGSGLIGLITFGGWDTLHPRAQITIANSSVQHVDIWGSLNGGTGGIIGDAQGTLQDLTIRGTFFNGNIHSRSAAVGGILGLVSGSNRITTIESSYAMGTFSSDLRNVGGLVGQMNKSGTTVFMNIRNSFAMARVESSERNGTTNMSVPGGLVGMGSSAAQVQRVFIHNSFFNTDLAGNTRFPTLVSPPHFTGGHDPIRAMGTITNTVGHMSMLVSQFTPAVGSVAAGLAATERTTAQMSSQTFVDLLNSGSAGLNLFELRNGAPRIVGNPHLTGFTFDANGGTFPVDGNPTEISRIWDEEMDFTGYNFPFPIKDGFTLMGWSRVPALPNAATDYPRELTGIPMSEGGRLYAVWSNIEFRLLAINDDQGGLNAQTTGFFGDLPLELPISTARIFGRGHVRTNLTTAVTPPATQNYFVGWQVLDAEGDWVDIGLGEEMLAAGAVGRRLDFFNSETGEYLLNEEFVRNFGIYKDRGFGDGSGHYITIRGLYENTPPVSINFSTQQIGYGTLRLEGATTNLLGTTTAGTNLQFVYDAGNMTPISLEVLPNAYHNHRLERRVGNAGTWTNVPTTRVGTTNVFRGSVTPEHDLQVRVVFERQEFAIRVATNLTMTPAQRDIAVSDSSVQLIRVGDTFGPVNLNDVPGFARQIDRFFMRNVRIGTQYLNMPNGVIEFEVTEDFLNQHYRGGEIVVEALFVRLFAISVVNLNSDLGTVRAFVSGREISPLPRYHDAGTVIELRLQMNAGVRLSLPENSGVDLSEVDQLGRNITIQLDRARDITVGFDIQALNLTVTAIDQNGWTIPHGVTLNATQGSIGPGATIENLSVTNYDSTALRFEGWYVLIGNTRTSFTDIGFDATQLSQNNIITLDAVVLPQVRDGMNIRLAARFTTVHQVTFNINGNGNLTAEVVEWDSAESEWTVVSGEPVITTTNSMSGVYDDDTYIRVTFNPDQFFMLDPENGIVGLIGLEYQSIDGNTFVINIGAMRTITINFLSDVFNLTYRFDVSNANGVYEISNLENLRVGDEIVITFSPSAMFQLSGFRINGSSIAQTPGAREAGNVVTLTLTPGLLQQLSARDYRVDIAVETVMNRTFVVGMIAGAVLIPLLLFVMLFIMLSNSKKKKQYALLQEKRKQGEIRMGQSDAIKRALDSGKKGQ